MYNCNTDSLGLIWGVEVFFSEGHCSGALCIVFVFAFLEIQQEMIIYAKLRKVHNFNANTVGGLPRHAMHCIYHFL